MSAIQQQEELEVLVSISLAWGRKRYVPENALAHKLLKVVGQKTFTEQSLQDFKELGYIFKLKEQSL